MAHLWKSFVDALAPPRQIANGQGEGVSLWAVRLMSVNCLTDEPSNRPEDWSSRAVPEFWEFQRADLNRAPARETSARVAEVDSSSEDEFQDSKEDPPSRSLAESVTATRVPQVATSQTAQPQPRFN